MLCHPCRVTKEKAEDSRLLGCYTRRLVGSYGHLVSHDVFVFKVRQLLRLLVGTEDEGSTILRHVVITLDDR